MRRLAIFPSPIFLASLLVALLTACGQKPDGTPYGVDPAKLPEGRRRAAAAAENARRPSPHATGVPKAAELNAITNGASAGQPHPAPGPAPAH